MKIVVLAVLLAVSQAPFPIPGKAPDAPDSSSQKVANHSKGNKHPPAMTPIENTPRPDPEQRDGQIKQPDNDEYTITVSKLPPVTMSKDTWDRAYFWLTAGLVSIGGLTLYAIWYQAKETRRAANAAVESIRLTHRPKVIIRSVVIPWMEIEKLKQVQNFLNAVDSYDGQLGGFFYAVNVGNQPAMIRSLDQYMLSGDRLPMERPYESGQQRKELNIRLQAGEAAKIAFAPIAMSEDQTLDAVLNDFYVIGRIIYTDEIGNSRETGFCRKLDRNLRKLVPVSDADYEYTD